MEDTFHTSPTRRQSRHRIPIWEGLIAWLLVLQLLWPGSPVATGWVHLLVLLAPLVVVPLGLQLSGQWSRSGPLMRWLYFPAVLLLSLSYCVPTMPILAWAALPWFVWTTSAAVRAIRQYYRMADGHRKLSDFSTLCSFLYLPVGAAWALADRLGLQPLGFDATIVVLTAAHFHYAGFVLPLIAGYLLRTSQQFFHRWLGWGIITGIPLVALGIVISHFGGPVWLESLFALFLAFSGMGLSFWQLGMSLQQAAIHQIPAMAGSILLAAGMILAVLYASRFFIDMPYLTIPWMYALHGTANAGACLLLLWRPHPTV